MRRHTTAVAAAVLLGGCATTPERPTAPPAATLSPGGPAPQPAVTLDAPIAHPDPEARRYLEELRAAIRRGWTYPCVPDPSTAGCVYPEGAVVVEIEIARDGALAFTTVVTASGHPELDAAATEAVKSAAPFAPVPAALKRPGPAVRIRAKMHYRHQR